MGFFSLLFRFTLIPCGIATAFLSYHSNVAAEQIRYCNLCAVSMKKHRQSFRLVVSYEGQKCDLDAYPDETILAALERSGVMDKLCLPAIPSDCRRGNCMTCAGRLLGDANLSQVLRGVDGLSPHVSDILQSSDYVLTCSSFIIGDGVEIVLGENSKVWDEVYHRRFTSDESRTTTLETIAKLYRLRAERNVPKWTLETEETLKRSGDSNAKDSTTL